MTLHPQMPSLDEPRGEYDHIFLALLPDEQAAGRAWALGAARRLRLGSRAYRTPRGCLHATVGGLAIAGRTSTGLLEGVMAAAARIALNPFVVEFNRLESWKGDPRPQVLTGEDGVIGLGLLREQLRLALAEAGIGVGWAANFTPHMTLLRGGPEAEIEYVAPVRWRVRDFVLVRSHVGQGRYTVLARCPLGRVRAA